MNRSDGARRFNRTSCDLKNQKFGKNPLFYGWRNSDGCCDSSQTDLFTFYSEMIGVHSVQFLLRIHRYKWIDFRHFANVSIMYGRMNIHQSAKWSIVCQKKTQNIDEIAHADVAIGRKFIEMKYPRNETKRKNKTEMNLNADWVTDKRPSVT